MSNSALTGLSEKDMGINSNPSASVSTILAFAVTSLMGEMAFTSSLSPMPRRLASDSLISINASD